MPDPSLLAPAKAKKARRVAVHGNALVRTDVMGATMTAKDVRFHRDELDLLAYGICSLDDYKSDRKPHDVEYGILYVVGYAHLITIYGMAQASTIIFRPGL